MVEMPVQAVDLDLWQTRFLLHGAWVVCAYFQSANAFGISDLDCGQVKYLRRKYIEALASIWVESMISAMFDYIDDAATEDRGRGV